MIKTRSHEPIEHDETSSSEAIKQPLIRISSNNSVNIGSLAERRAARQQSDEELRSLREAARTRGEERARKKRARAFYIAGTLALAATAGYAAQGTHHSSTPEATATVESPNTLVVNALQSLKDGKAVSYSTEKIILREPVSSVENGATTSAEVYVNPIILSEKGRTYYAYFLNGEPNINDMSAEDAATLMSETLIDSPLSSNQLGQAHLNEAGIIEARQDGKIIYPGQTLHIENS